MSEPPREHDVVVFGASGFTGRLVAEFLHGSYGSPSQEVAPDGAGLRWAMAGRSRDKLERIRDELGAGDVPLVVADADDARSLSALAASARVVCTTVGPYALYGSGLVEACARAGTHCCDLTGEVPWMHRMIAAHQETAVATGARIVHTCGFDSIPSDLGVLFLQDAMRERHGVPARHVKLRVSAARGSMSGGTAASLIHMLEEAGRERRVRELLADPYALLPDGAPRGPDRNDQTSALWDPDFERWTLPFVMAGINTRVVRRSNALLGFPWGEEFRYDEAMLAPEGRGGLRSRLAAFAMMAGMVSLAVPPVRAVVKRFLPSPGEGPSAEERERGFYDLLLYGVHPEDRDKDLMARVTGDRDPGYGSTSKMLGEAAVCLARDELACGGGFWTPASAMGRLLIDRLESKAGLTFSIVDSREG